MTYHSGFSDSYWDWIGKFSNHRYDYFARHNQGRPIDYTFNSKGYRGPEHHDTPDISVFGSSFSFGVGIEFNKCWHQNLGDYRVNCYAPAGILVTNNDIIEHYRRTEIKSEKVILQLREFRYNTFEIQIPHETICFVVDEMLHPNILNFPWASWVDRAEDNTHPGPQTHQIWALEIKKTFKL